MSIISGSIQGNRAPDNISSGDWTITVTTAPGYVCGSTVQPFDLSSATMTAGRWVLVRVLPAAGGITGYVGATVTPPSGLSVYSISRENVNYSGTTYDCVVVTLA